MDGWLGAYESLASALEEYDWIFPSISIEDVSELAEVPEKENHILIQGEDYHRDGEDWCTDDGWPSRYVKFQGVWMSEDEALDREDSLYVPLIITNETTWMVRSGRGSDLLPQFRSKGLVSLGWSSAGDLAGAHTRDEIKALVVDAKPDKTSAQAGRIAGYLHRFRNGIKPGHNVVTYDSGMRVYHIGVVEGEYEFNLEDGDPFAHRIAVRWTGQVERDALDVAARKPLNARMSIFEVPSAAFTPASPNA
jgi:hypothetical protein